MPGFDRESFPLPERFDLKALRHGVRWCSCPMKLRPITPHAEEDYGGQQTTKTPNPALGLRSAGSMD
jgi:hypothetical protein